MGIAGISGLEGRAGSPKPRERGRRPAVSYLQDVRRGEAGGDEDGGELWSRRLAPIYVLDGRSGVKDLFRVGLSANTVVVAIAGGETH
jgi:hypothetical protein